MHISDLVYMVKKKFNWNTQEFTSIFLEAVLTHYAFLSCLQNWIELLNNSYIFEFNYIYAI